MSLVSNYDYLIKLIIIGDTCINPIKIDVGKSNILTQYVQKKFKIDHEITIGVEFLAKNIQINNKLLRLQVWDTAGQESFRSITRSYYKNSACAIIVYDITNRGSFKKIENWLKECLEMSPKSIVLVLVGNKVDLSEIRQVTESEALEFANSNNMLYFETSAKTGYNIENVFYSAAEKIVENIENKKIDLESEGSGIRKGEEGNGILVNLARKKSRLASKCCK